MSATTDEHYMRLALDACRAGVALGQSPFAAVIVRDGVVLATRHNQVWLDTDATAHAEVLAIREACRARGGIDLSGCTIYSTTEPCPMCFSAIHWARVGRIVYAAAIEDARQFGFNELAVSSDTLKAMGRLSVELSPGVLREEAVAVFREWQGKGGRAY